MPTARLAGCLLAAVAAICFTAPYAVAQETGTVAGVVRDSTGALIAGAELRIEGTDRRAVSDEHGRFRMRKVPTGPVALRLRRLGFAPAALDTTLVPDDDLTLQLVIAPIAQPLGAVVVRAVAQRYTGRFAGFYERRDRGMGRYISREQIAKRNPVYMTDMFRQVPGVRLVRTRWMEHAVRLRNASCPPQVWMDGVPLGAEFDFDALPPNSVEGVEVYGVGTVPTQFNVGYRSGCGTMVVWTRDGEPRAKRRKKDKNAEAVALFTAQQVERPALPDTAATIPPQYPRQLREHGVGGRVLAEFVVDTLGAVESETFGIVSTTHPELTEAVRQAVIDSRFHPAVLGGRRVRQVVQQPFEFVPQPRNP